MPALQRKADFGLSLDPDTGYRPGIFLLECFYDILGLGMFRLAIDAAKSASHAELFIYIYPLQFDSLLQNPLEMPTLNNSTTQDQAGLSSGRLRSRIAGMATATMHGSGRSGEYSAPKTSYRVPRRALFRAAGEV